MSEVGQLVSDLKEVVSNIEKFNNEINNHLPITGLLTQFKHWYYIPHLNLFGPSKFIGYKFMDSDQYTQIKGKPSIESQKALNEWFYPLQENSIEARILREQLGSVLEIYDKKLRANAVFHIPKNTFLLVTNK
ncbi:hypothetical protein [Litchfieldia alkalitelluris]|uniref:hypothetical protein n=1 Tax=Litchfieldia alkalitelluris TaxID=304268 RepID=UPI00099710B9|nr:hypothetical protein [Litchfieldia alkalitelluris]